MAGKTQRNEMKNPTCISCGKLTVCVVENRKTGEITHVFDKCKNCLMEGALSYRPITEKVTLKDELE